MELSMRELSSSNIMVPSFARGLNILLVDYDTTSLMYLASMLEQYSYKVTTTELASVALSMIREENDRFKLAIANVNMPGMDCFSFLQVLLKKEIPVILMTSERSLSAARKALAEGACFFLEKPISFDDLKYIWQHAYKSRTNPSRVEARKANREMLNHEKISQRTKITEAGSVSRIATGNDLQYSTNYQHIKADQKGKKKQIMEVDQAVVVDENTVKESQRQGGTKTKRPWRDDQVRKRKEKRIKLDSARINDDHMKLFEEIERELMSDNSEEIEKPLNDNDVSSQRKGSRRFIWTPELHLKFTAALSALESRKARPKLILKMMNVPHLTKRQVASHLQKYKAQVQRIAAKGGTDLPSGSRPVGINGSRIKSVQQREKMIKPSASQPGRRNSNIAFGGTNQAANIMPGDCSSGNVPNAGKSPGDFIYGNQEVNATMISAPAASGSAAGCSVNQNQPSPEYADMLKLLDEEEGLTGVGSGPNASDVDRYYEWLTEALLGDNQLPPYFTPRGAS